MVNITINGQPLAVENGTTILSAAAQMGIPIPHLCYLKGINEIGACRMCMVEVEGTERLVTACNTGVVEGMAIHTNTPKVREARKTNLRLILSQHNSTCTTCIRSGNCELQRLAHDLNIHYQPYPVKPERSHLEMDVPIIREASKCIKCMRCIQVCDKIQGMHIWDVTGTGCPHHGGCRLQPLSQGHGLHLLRPVRHPLPHRRPDRPGRHQPGAATLWRIRR